MGSARGCSFPSRIISHPFHRWVWLMLLSTLFCILRCLLLSVPFFLPGPRYSLLHPHLRFLASVILPTPGIVISIAIFSCFDFSSPPCRRAHVLRSFSLPKKLLPYLPFYYSSPPHARVHTSIACSLPFLLFGSLLFYAGYRHALERGRFYFRSDVASLGLKFTTVKLVSFLAMQLYHY